MPGGTLCRPVVFSGVSTGHSRAAMLRVPRPPLTIPSEMRLTCALRKRGAEEVPVSVLEVLPGEGNVVFLSRRGVPEPKQVAIARLRALLPPGSILYAVRRAHDDGFGWIVCDFYRIDTGDVTCLTEEVARALDCFDPRREVGVKLRRAQGHDPLAGAIDGRLSMLLHGEPGEIGQRMIG